MTRNRVAAVAGGALVVVYPFAVYAGLSRWRPGAVAVLLVAFAGARFAVSAVTRPRGVSVLHAAWPMLPVVALAALATVLDDGRFLLAMPVLMSAVLLASFGATLRTGVQPAVERFARLQQPVLSSDEVAWCRGVTKVWCLFFVLNGATAGTLAFVAPIEWWTLYSGLVAYLFMGVLFGAEFVLRKMRFRGIRAPETAK